MVFIKKTLPILFGIFIISVLIRVPNLDRPLSKHHEFCTAVTLRTLQIWADNGGSTYSFLPVMTYPGSVNKYINNQSSEIFDKEGNYYYVSYPPLSYLIPFAFFELFQIYPTPIALQIFNLAIHLIIAVFIYLILCFLLDNKVSEQLTFPALIGATIYLLLPATLWFHSNVYMADILTQLFWVISIYIMLKISEYKQGVPTIWKVYLGVVVFLMVYSSWLGVICAITIILYFLNKMRFDRKNGNLLFITVHSVVLAVLVMGIQYSLISGFTSYFEVLFERFVSRSGYDGAGFYDLISRIYTSCVAIATNYATSYLPAIVILLFGLLFLRKRISLSDKERMIIYFSVIPVVMLHLLLLNYSGHDFTTLPAAVFISISIAIVYAKLKGILKSKYQYLLNSGIIIMVVLSVVQYYVINRPGDRSWKRNLYNVQRDFGEYIKEEAKPDEVVFLRGIDIEPQVIYYAKRNIKRFLYPSQAKEHLQKVNQTKGILFDIEWNQDVVVRRFVADNEN